MGGEQQERRESPGAAQRTEQDQGVGTPVVQAKAMPGDEEGLHDGKRSEGERDDLQDEGDDRGHQPE
jgi:hypothetical protein